MRGGPFGLIAGTQTLVVGVEDDPGGGLRMYLRARHLRVYSVIHPADEGELVRGWAASFAGHLVVDLDVVPVPPHATLPGHDPGHHERGALR